MATYDLTASTTATGRPSRMNPGVRTPYLVENTVDITKEYVQIRKIFGKPVAAFQNTKFQLAECATDVEVGQSFMDDILVRHMNNESLVKEVSMAKYWLSDMQFRVADKCLQLFGGYGYMKEYPISRFWTDARLQRIYGGTNEVMKVLIAQQIGLSK